MPSLPTLWAGLWGRAGRPGVGWGALNWWQQQQQSHRPGADGRPDGRTVVTLPYPVQSQVDLRQNPDAGLHPQKSCPGWFGASPGDPHPGDSHAPVTKAENCHLVRFPDFRWVCAPLDGSRTVLLSRASSVTCVLCLILCDPITVARQAPLSVGILQARILEWVAMPSSRGSSQPRDQIQVSCTAGRFFTI